MADKTDKIEKASEGADAGISKPIVPDILDVADRLVREGPTKTHLIGKPGDHARNLSPQEHRMHPTLEALETLMEGKDDDKPAVAPEATKPSPQTPVYATPEIKDKARRFVEQENATHVKEHGRTLTGSTANKPYELIDLTVRKLADGNDTVFVSTEFNATDLYGTDYMKKEGVYHYHQDKTLEELASDNKYFESISYDCNSNAARAASSWIRKYRDGSNPFHRRSRHHIVIIGSGSHDIDRCSALQKLISEAEDFDENINVSIVHHMMERAGDVYSNFQECFEDKRLQINKYSVIVCQPLPNECTMRNADGIPYDVEPLVPITMSNAFLYGGPGCGSDELQLMIRNAHSGIKKTSIRAVISDHTRDGTRYKLIRLVTHNAGSWAASTDGKAVKFTVDTAVMMRKYTRRVLYAPKLAVPAYSSAMGDVPVGLLGLMAGGSIRTDYRSKYLKYKTKYLELKSKSNK